MTADTRPCPRTLGGFGGLCCTGVGVHVGHTFESTSAGDAEASSDE